VIADGDSWKLQSVLVFHADVNVLGMRQKVHQLGRNEVCEETAKTEDY